MEGRVTAGRHTIVPDDIDCYVDLELGSFCSIASGLKIVSGQHPSVDHPDCVSTFPFFEHEWGEYPHCRPGGSVEVGSDVWIGQDVRILVGVNIGHGATVGADAVVTRYVPPYAVVAGNPAEIKGVRFPRDTVTKLLDLAWWTWPDDAIQAALPHMANVHSFLAQDWTPVWREA